MLIAPSRGSLSISNDLKNEDSVDLVLTRYCKKNCVTKNQWPSSIKRLLSYDTKYMILQLNGVNQPNSEFL